MEKDVESTQTRTLSAAEQAAVDMWHAREVLGHGYLVRDPQVIAGSLAAIRQIRADVIAAQETPPADEQP